MYLAANDLESVHFGAMLCAVKVRSGFSLEFLIPTGKGKLIVVHAVGLEDRCIAPDHLLLEGTNAIKLVLDDPKLSREYLESLDSENARSDYPDRVQMLRHGCTWVIAAEFLAEEMPVA
jgi:hypothetical protein